MNTPPLPANYPYPLETEEIRLWRPLAIAGTHLFNAIDAALKAAADLTHLDHLTLLSLRAAPAGGRRMSEIAAIFGVDPSVITYRVKRLEARGLVRREASATDGRVVLVGITPGGLALMDALAPVHAAAVRESFLRFLSPEEAEAIAVVFRRLVAIQFRESPVLSLDPPDDLPDAPA